MLSQALPLALRVRPDCLQGIRGGNVDPATFLRWARCEAAHANADGTHLIVSVHRVADELGVSAGTVRRCRAAARRLGVYRTLLWGRSGTLAERLEGRSRRGGPRRIANESCFALPRWLAVALAAERRRRRRSSISVEYGTPPGGASYSTSKKVAGDHITRRPGRDATDAATPRSPKRRSGPRPSQLARALVHQNGRIPWLRGQSAARITPALRVFEQEGWSTLDLQRALKQLDPKRWDVREARQPWALLPWYLRRLDPYSDRPSLQDEIEAERRERDRVRTQLDIAVRRALGGPTPEYRDLRRRAGLDSS